MTISSPDPFSHGIHVGIQKNLSWASIIEFILITEGPAKQGPDNKDSSCVPLSMIQAHVTAIKVKRLRTRKMCYAKYHMNQTRNERRKSRLISKWVSTAVKVTQYKGWEGRLSDKTVVVPCCSIRLTDLDIITAYQTENCCDKRLRKLLVCDLPPWTCLC